MASNVTRDHHNLRRNLKLNGNYISNDGGDEGVKITDGGNVGINTTVVAPLSKFEVFNSNVQLDAGTTGYQTGTSFVSTASDFTAAMVGGRIIFDDGTDAGIIIALLVSNIVTVSTSQTVGGSGDQRAFKVYYPAVQIDTGASSTSLKIGNTSFDTSSGDISLAANGGGNIVMTDGTSNIFDFDVAAPSLTIYDDADTDGDRDYFKVTVGANGATELLTNDDDGNSGSLQLKPDGFLRLWAGVNKSCQITHDDYTASGTTDHIVQLWETLNLSSGAGGSDTHYGVWYKQTWASASAADGWDNVYLMYLQKYVTGVDFSDVFAVDSSALLSITTTGTAKSITDVITITNEINAADMDGTGSAIKFNQWYYDGSSPAIEDAAKIAIATETDWTSTASTRDSYMAFSTSLDGTLAEKLRITSAGNVGIGVADPDSLLEVMSTGNILKLSRDADDYLLFTQQDSGGYSVIESTGGIQFKVATGDDFGVYEVGNRRFSIVNSGSDTKLSLVPDSNDTGDAFEITVTDAGATTIAATDDDGEAAHLTLDVDGSIILDSHTGATVAKKAGTEFSVANSAYAGMILGYTTVGIDAADDSYTVTASFAVTDSAHKVKFVAPPSGVVEIYVSIYVDLFRRLLYLGLSDNATYNALDVTHEHVISTPPTAGGDRQINHRWVITGLTAGTAYEYWLGAKSTHALANVLRWGGNVTDEYQPFIMKATALPTAVADFAVYG